MHFIPDIPHALSDAQLCLTCPMAKLSKLPFDLSDSHSPEKFGLVHLDIWGPYKVPTKGNLRYFLTIVDDHSRYTWLTLLAYKSDFFSSFQTFFNYVKTHFSTTIKTIRSDNALEFLDNKCSQFFAQHGIVHQKSCSHRPQQNARVERKHRYIHEIARSIRFHAHLPLSFWGYCVETVVYLMNRLPSSVLNNVSPYEILSKEPPTYSHLKVIGCLAFAVNPSFTTDKLAARAVPCLFIGYPASRKGYQLLDLTTNKTFTSRDVQFHETVFPFHPDSISKYMTHLPVKQNVIQPHSLFDDIC